MKTNPVLIFLLALLPFSVTLAQNTLPLPLNITQAIQKGTRTFAGVPGIRYWQNSADYSIQVHFDPATRLVSGTEQITYQNQSHDTLRELLFKLYPNIFQKGAIRASSVKPEDLTEGVSISNCLIDKVGQNIKPIPAGTNLQVPITHLLPGHSTQVSLSFSYTLNKTSHLRTGQIDSAAFFIAYFFPRIAGYDDIDGWNNYPYIGSQEFYNDFCHFHVTITVPDNYIVWATGDLKNREEVLSPKYISRIEEAEKSNGITRIIDSSDLSAGDITLHSGSHSWHFEANEVTDFVFAISNHYIWNASGVETDPSTKRRTRVDAVFNPNHRDYYDVIGFARKTVDYMSSRFPKWPFPYSHETVFDGLDQMEYPMMVNDNPLSDHGETVYLTDHEIFHTMFPFYMGINETKYGWMDEGWATLGEWFLSPMIDSSLHDKYGMEEYNESAGKESDLPIITLTTELSGVASYLNSYPKPGLGYLYAKDILGDSAFFSGLHFYISHWHGKHPIPTDFFYSMNAGSGKNLNWFWKRWFYDDGYPDLAIRSVRNLGKEYEIIIRSIGTKPVPVDLTIFYDGHSTEKIHRNAACWEKNNREITLHVSAMKKIDKLELGSLYVPDVNPKDNRWSLSNN